MASLGQRRQLLERIDFSNALFSPQTPPRRALEHSGGTAWSARAVALVVDWGSQDGTAGRWLAPGTHVETVVLHGLKPSGAPPLPCAVPSCWCPPQRVNRLCGRRATIAGSESGCTEAAVREHPLLAGTVSSRLRQEAATGVGPADLEWQVPARLRKARSRSEAVCRELPLAGGPASVVRTRCCWCGLHPERLGEGHSHNTTSGRLTGRQRL